MKYSVIVFIVLSLQACMNVATTGAQAVYNHRSLQKSVNDQLITMHAFQSLHYKSKDFKDANVSVSTYNGEVLLSGQTPTAWQKTKAEEIVKQIPDIKEVYNLITVASPSSILTRLSDAWITTKVKGKLIASADVDATQIKVITENGTVYLMGILPHEEALVAADLASETEGVQSVVKVFSYVTVSKDPKKSS